MSPLKTQAPTQDQCVHSRLRQCSSSTSCVDVTFFLFPQRPLAGWHIALWDSICLYSDRKLILRFLFIPLSTRKFHSRVKASITSSKSTFLSLTLVTKKLRYLPGTAETEGGNSARHPIPGLGLSKNSPFWYCLLKSASSLLLKLISAVMQIALALFHKMKPLSMIKLFSEYSLGISNSVLKFLQW